MASPSDFDQLAARAKFQKIYDFKPAAQQSDGYFRPKYPPPPPKVAPKEINDSWMRAERRIDQGFNTPRPLQNNPNVDRSLVPGQKISPGGGGANPTAPRTPNFLERGLNRLTGESPGAQVGNRNPITANPITGPLSDRVARSLKGLANPVSYIPGLVGGQASDQINQYDERLRQDVQQLLEKAGVPRAIADAASRLYDTGNKLQNGGEYTPGGQATNPTLVNKALDLAKQFAGQSGILGPLNQSIKDSGIPDWLNPFKDTSKNGERTNYPNPSDKPSAESKAWFPNATKIRVWSPNNRRYVTYGMLSYSITALPKYNQGTSQNPKMSARSGNFTYLREGTDDYIIQFSFWTYADSFATFKVAQGSFNCEPWTLENLGLDPTVKDPNPESPENIVPETNQPFFPPLPKYLDDIAQPYPPTILDPNDFRHPGKPPTPPTLPSWPSLPQLDPPPFDPLKEEKKEQEANPVAPIFPSFNPTDTPRLPIPQDPIPTPPTFQPIPPTNDPTPQNPNQRLNDRGIFPATKATITPTVSGSPLSPDVEIGGDPVRLKPINPKTKPIPTTDPDPTEQKKKDDERTLPFPLLPPIFPRPTGPTGTIDPQTADDITKSKNPPPPPVGTKPKCQDGCMAGLETGQQSILDKLNGNGLNVGLNAAELGLLTTINNKMGDQLTGGLSGKLTRLSSWLHLDRALNLMTYANTLHNAYFLSSGLTQTLFSMISNVLAVVGIKDAENNPLDIGSVLGKAADAYAKTVLGVTTVDGIKAEWKKYSRIYAAAASLLWSMQSIGQSILGALEVVGSMVAKIGNALRKFGAIGEKAFGWMNDTPNYQNRFFTALEKTEEVVSQIDQVASEALSIKDTVDQIGVQKKELDDALKQNEESKQGKELSEAAKLKTDETKKKTDSQPPIVPPTAEKKPEN